MRRKVLLVLFIIVLPAFALSQVPKDETKKMPPDKTDVGQTLIKLDRDLLDAMLKKDNSMADRVEVANHVFINPGGGVEVKRPGYGSGTGDRFRRNQRGCHIRPRRHCPVNWQSNGQREVYEWPRHQRTIPVYEGIRKAKG